jgi:mannose-6-phosphate isomerase-like protein (cupin superfamily)
MGVVVKHVERVEQERGSCGARRRLILAEDCAALGLSHVKIGEAREHFHRESWEIYFVLAGDGSLHVDGEAIPLRAGTAVLVPPGSRHRAVSNRDLEVLVIMSPATAEGGDIVYVEGDA